MDRIQASLPYQTPPPPDFPSPSLVGEGGLGRVGGSSRRPMDAVCPPTSGNPGPSNVVPCSPTVPCLHHSQQPANRFQFSSTDSLPAAGCAWAGALARLGFCVLRRSPPAPAHLGCHSAIFPSLTPCSPCCQRPSFKSHWPRPRPPAATVWIVSSQQIDICFPACTITGPWSTRPLRRDYQRGVSIAEVGAAAEFNTPTTFVNGTRVRLGRHPERTPPFTHYPLIARQTHTAYTPRLASFGRTPFYFPRMRRT